MINTDRAKIIERIQLLLNLGRSPNANEAEAAVAMAAKLMDDYRLSKEDIDAADSNICQADIGTMRALVEHRSIMMLLQDYFNVTALSIQVGRMWQISLYGKQGDLDIAVQIYHTLLSAFKQRWNKHKHKTSDRTSFMHGVYRGVAYQLKQQREARPHAEQNALVVINQNNSDAVIDFLTKRGKTIKTRKEKRVIDKNTYAVGFTEGVAINVFEQIDGGTRRLCNS